jgi:hypothetical protein
VLGPPDHDRCAVKLPDVQIAQNRLLGGFCGDQVDLREIGRELLDGFFVVVYTEHLVP